jgi:F-type H+-transporting ATPase subunit gamma
MKMVSATKLKAQDAITMRPYAENWNYCKNLSATMKVMQEVTTQRDIQKVLLVVVTSNRGGLETFNTNAIKG